VSTDNFVLRKWIILWKLFLTNLSTTFSTTENDSPFTPRSGATVKACGKEDKKNEGNLGCFHALRTPLSMHLQPKSSLSFAKHTIPFVIKSAEVKKKENPYCFNRHHRLYNRKRSVKYFSDLPRSFRLCFESNHMISSVLHYHTHKWANKKHFFWRQASAKWLRRVFRCPRWILIGSSFISCVLLWLAEKNLFLQFYGVFWKCETYKVV